MEAVVGEQAEGQAVEQEGVVAADQVVAAVVAREEEVAEAPVVAEEALMFLDLEVVAEALAVAEEAEGRASMATMK